MAPTRACMFALVMALAFLFFLDGSATAARTAGTSSAQRRRQVRSLLRRLNKPPLATIESPDGDIIDCVHISKQPAFDHPLLKNHTIQMMPSCHPEGLCNKSTIAPNPFTQTWHQNGKCPENTIPIRRTKEEDVLRESSIERYGKKWPWSIPNRFSIDDPDAVNVLRGHQHAIASASEDENYYGTQATFNLSEPIVEREEGFSLAQFWISSGSYSKQRPQYCRSRMAGSAASVEWGGEVASSPDAGQTSTQTGSGHFPEEGFSKASYVKNIQLVDSTNNLKSPSGVNLLAKWPKCYNAQNGTSADWGTYIFYGGPGKNPNCQ